MIDYHEALREMNKGNDDVIRISEDVKKHFGVKE